MAGSATRVAVAAALCALQLLGAASQSVKSCGGASDHFSNVKVSLSPDPIKKGKPFTITLSGTLDADLAALSVDADLKVSALDIIHLNIKNKQSVTVSPGLAHGNQQLTIGPVTLPKHIPGSAELTGQVKIANAKGEPVACLELALNVPGVESEEDDGADDALSESVAALSADGCRKPTDHLKSFKSATSGGVTTTTATLDEDINTLSVDVDLHFKALFVSIPLKLKIPVSYSPGLKKGDVKITTQRSSVSLEEQLKLGVKMTGQIGANDSKGEEITCVAVAWQPDMQTAPDMPIFM